MADRAGFTSEAIRVTERIRNEVVTRMAGNELLLEVRTSLSTRMRWLLSQHDDLAGIARERSGLYEAVASRGAGGMEPFWYTV